MRVGADIGGTFTDVVLTDEQGGFRVHKLLTTPDQPDDAVVEGVEAVLGDNEFGQLGGLVHGTTLFTNALIERKGSKTALITTKGFRDAIEIGREHRYDMYDLFMRRPEPLAPRRFRYEVVERILADGSVQTPLDEKGLRHILKSLVAEGIEAVGVCLLHAYANPAHERRIGEVLAREHPDLTVTLSCEIAPEIREYERTSTTLANAYVQRTAKNYLGRLRHRLGRAGYDDEFFVMQSNGGVCTVDTAQRFPIKLVESGPAAGALAAAEYGEKLGLSDVLSFDMGGTTAKACLIVDGQPSISPDFEVDRKYQFKKGSGLPVKIPVIEMIEVGTGGGSLAGVDALGRLTVGPESAGANPGPAAYGLGGKKPTVTDADLVLGYLDPSNFLGGQMQLDTSAAREAILKHVAEPTGLTLVEAAWGIHQLANETMASAARIHAVEQGKDVSRFPIFAFGGAGPVHAFGVARILRSRSVIYPLYAGVMSAIGFLTAPLSVDQVKSIPGPIEAYDWDGASAAVIEMRRETAETLVPTVLSEQVSHNLTVDMRYRKQGYEVRVPFPDLPLDSSVVAPLKAAFERAYQSLYGHTVPNTPIDIVSWRVSAYGPDPDFRIPPIDQNDGAPVTRTRRVYLPDMKQYSNIQVLDRYSLAPGMAFEGPAIVEERESTVVVGKNATARIDTMGNLIVDLLEPVK